MDKPIGTIVFGLILILISAIVPRMLLYPVIYDPGAIVFYATITTITTVMFWVGLVILIVGVLMAVRD